MRTCKSSKYFQVFFSLMWGPLGHGANKKLPTTIGYSGAHLGVITKFVDTIPQYQKTQGISRPGVLFISFT